MSTHRNPHIGTTLCLAMMLSVCLVLLAIPMQAQVETTSSISGTVTDSTGCGRRGNRGDREESRDGRDPECCHE